MSGRMTGYSPLVHAMLLVALQKKLSISLFAESSLTSGFSPTHQSKHWCAMRGARTAEQGSMVDKVPRERGV